MGGHRALTRRVVLRAMGCATLGALAGCSGPAAAPIGEATAPPHVDPSPSGASPSGRSTGNLTSAPPAPPSATSFATPGSSAQRRRGARVAQAQQREALVARYQGARPSEWGLAIPGVITRISTGERIAALTLDACGGPGGEGYDAAIIDVLERHEVPATLFLNARWARANDGVTRALADNPLFEIANHGVAHRPLSAAGRAAYGIAGTRDVGEIVDELIANQPVNRIVEGTAGLMRAGTAHVDDVAVRIATDLGIRIVNFTVNADRGGTAAAGQVAGELAPLKPGDIAIGHINRPGSGTAAGLHQALPRLIEQGWRFVRLSDPGVTLA